MKINTPMAVIEWNCAIHFSSSIIFLEIISLNKSLQCPNSKLMLTKTVLVQRAQGRQRVMATWRVIWWSGALVKRAVAAVSDQPVPPFCSPAIVSAFILIHLAILCSTRLHMDWLSTHSHFSTRLPWLHINICLFMLSFTNNIIGWTCLLINVIL